MKEKKGGLEDHNSDLKKKILFFFYFFFFFLFEEETTATTTMMMTVMAAVTLVVALMMIVIIMTTTMRPHNFSRRAKQMNRKLGEDLDGLFLDSKKNEEASNLRVVTQEFRSIDFDLMGNRGRWT